MKKISILSKNGDCRNFIYISVLMVTLLVSGISSPTVVAQITGVAPTVTPSGGCAIDGDLLARVPTSPAPFTSSVGDMLENPSAPGTGGGIFTNPGGVSLDPAAFHVIDGYGGAPQSPNPDVDVFTQGSKFNQDPNTWHWTSGKPPQKDDMNNALFHVTEDAQGHSWFVGSGDRLAINGTSYIDFELYQKRVTKNANGTFTSLGLDGGRTVGDLVITIDYSNGGTNAGAVVFRWEETSPGVFDYVLYTPPVGTIYAASNIGGTVSVPFGAFGSTTYQQFSYAEVAANLNHIIPGLDECIGIATVLIKTKSSDSDDAELKDFMEPVQVQLGTVPIVNITPANPTLCNGQSTTLTANVTFPPNGPFTWAWTSDPVGFTSTDQSITVSPSATTHYIVVVTGPNGCQSAPDTATVTVNQPPTCSITGSDGPVCPSTSLDFTAPDGMDSYSWSITGNGTISGPDDEQTVTVIADTDCGVSFVLTSDITNSDGCPNTCSKEIMVKDTIAPEITGVGDDATIECPATPLFSEPSASDLCDDDPLFTFEDVTTPGDCPQAYSVTRTWTATDACGNSSTASQTITVEDNTAPEITGIDDVDTVECPATPEFPTPTVSDLCDDNPLLTFEDETTQGDCPQEYSVIRTWTATDACGNSSQASLRITVVDNTAPEITGVGPDTTVICPDEPVFSTPSASDLCDADPSLTFVTDSIPGDCPQSYTLTRTWTAVDACGNTSTATQTIIHLPNPHPEIVLSARSIILGDTIFASCGEDVNIPFPEINTPCGPAEVFFTRSDGGVWEDPYETGTTDVCYWGISPCGFSTDTICFAVVVAECGQEFCSLTQGFYGNAGGKYCNGPTTTQLLNTLLASGPLVVGCGNNTMTYSSAQCIIDLLPGGGPSKKITGNNTCASHPGIQIKNGTIYNSLLAQTTTLGLNLRLSPTLGDLLIATNTLVSSPSPSCNADPGDLTFTFPALAVGLTVTQLYALANNALGGCVTGVSLDNITSALDAINRGFDKCRIGHFVTPLQASIAPPPDSKVENQDLSLVSLTSYPNPFSSIANITFSVPYSGHVKVDVYTMTGVKVQTVFDNSVEADMVYTAEFKGQPQIFQATYICVISTELGTKYQRIMMVR